MTADLSAEATRRARFEAVFAEVYEPLQRYARRRTDPASADDVVADALLVVWRRLDDVPTDGALPWCYGVARRCLANQDRSARRGDRLALRLAAQPVVTVADGDADGLVLQALARLGDDDRELLRLWAWEQLPPWEIGVVLGVSPNAVSIRLYRAKRRLAAALRHEPDRLARVVRKIHEGTGHEQGADTTEVAG
jgi:RNA polymerase sigma-70 factor (ECF subfamily)